MKKTFKIILILIIFLINGHVQAETVDLETIKPNDIILNNKKYKKYIEYQNQEDAQQQILKKFDATIKKISKYTNKNINIDDEATQQYLLDIDIYETIEDKEFRNAIDIYENKNKNSRMNELFEKYLVTTDLIEKQKILNELDEISAIDDTMINNTMEIQGLFKNKIAFNEESYSLMGMPTPYKPLEPGKYANGYDRNKARDYTYDWALKRNNSKYGYYSRRNGNCENCWYDCTNFISQILYEAGMKQYYKAYWPIVGNIIQENNKNWYYYDDRGKEAPSYTWGGAHNFYKHWSNRAIVTTNLSKVQIMDPISIDFDGDGDIDHTVIVLFKHYSRLDGIYYAAHSNDRRGEVTLESALNNKSKWYAYQMKYADN